MSSNFSLAFRWPGRKKPGTHSPVSNRLQVTVVRGPHHCMAHLKPEKLRSDFQKIFKPPVRAAHLTSQTTEEHRQGLFPVISVASVV